MNARKISFHVHGYSYEDHGGTERAANELDLPEYAVIKTLILETDKHRPFVMLMHGDREVSLKQLARELQVKHVFPCAIETAQKLTGYLVGGISPFGTRSPLPVYVESTIFTLDRIYIMGKTRIFGRNCTAGFAEDLSSPRGDCRNSAMIPLTDHHGIL